MEYRFGARTPKSNCRYCVRLRTRLRDSQTSIQPAMRNEKTNNFPLVLERSDMRYGDLVELEIKNLIMETMTFLRRQRRGDV